MLSSLIGSVIMSAVTIAMLIAINVINKGLNNVGKFSLTDKEIEILKKAGYIKLKDIKDIDRDLTLLEFD